MFSQLFFVLLALILINFTSETNLTFWIEDPKKALQWSVLGYVLLLAILTWQSKIFHALNQRMQSLWESLVNLEVLFFLGIYHFGLGAQRFFLKGTLASYQTPYTLVSLLLYFMALGWAHLWHSYFQLHCSLRKAFKNAYHQLLFYCPFCLPFIVMSFLLDELQHLPAWQNETLPLSQDLILFLLSLSLLGLTLIFLPAFIVICWRCKPLERFDVEQRLEQLCTTLHFRHAGLKIWSIMPHSFTAGIIGVIPCFRYILFTPALLKRFRVEEIEAILIHEIGHNHYKHLLCIPFILLGMVVLGTLFLIGLENILFLTMGKTSSTSTYFMLIMTLFVFYALLMGTYFRLVFGFFSRLFERQADLHIFSTPLSPVYLIQALDHLGVVNGYTHDHPSWHHFSLQKRIRFLYQAMDNPSLINRHHRQVKKWLMIYFVGLLAACLALYWII